MPSTAQTPPPSPDFTKYPYNLPVSFHFTLEVSGKSSGDDIKFQEVGGLTAEIGSEDLVVGGENRFTYHLPSTPKYGNLILKRGIITNSSLIAWFSDAIENFIFEPADVKVNLLNEKGEPVVFWNFIQAYPVKWAISDFNANGNTLAIETIELAYQYFLRDKTESQKK